MFNLLTEPLFRMETGDAPHANASLPEVYTALMRDDVEAFPALRPHQRHAWHAFLVQLGAMALHSTSVNEPPADAADWAALIRGLMPDFPDDEPWRLVVDDITKPAFMQPPASSEDKAEEYKHRVTTPDALDMLGTSKNHDLKSLVAMQAGVEDWIFALITLQTMGEYSAAGSKEQYHTISRMNGSYGSRPAVSLTPSLRLGCHVRRDIMGLLERWDSILSDFPGTDDGITLVWARPWNGMKEDALSLEELNPFYIEICRRVRLRSNADGNLYGVKTGSKAGRIPAKDRKGRTGDPWTPVNKSKKESLTPRSDSFTCKRIVEYLTSADWERPPLLNPTESERRFPMTMQLIARGITKVNNGKGKTDGYYERIIPLRPTAVRSLGSGEEAGDLGALAKERVEKAGKVRNILRDAIATFCNEGNDIYKLKKRDLKKLRFRDEINRLIALWDELVDARFFDDLQTELEADETERERIRHNWLRNGTDGLVDHARHVLHAAEDALPCSTGHRYRAHAQARDLFEGRIRGSRGLPFLFRKSDEEKL